MPGGTQTEAEILAYTGGADYVQSVRHQSFDEVMASLPAASQRLVMDYVNYGYPMPAVIQKYLVAMGVDISTLR
jgi:hypothetical protein